MDAPTDQSDMATVEEVLTLLRANGGRVTSSRRVLLEVLFERGGHRTAEELAEAVQVETPDVHLSTIYRNLEELERLGVIVHGHTGHGPATYHLATMTHGHFVCDQCGLVIEAPVTVFAGLADEARSRFGFEISPHHFAVLGRCRACQGTA